MGHYDNCRPGYCGRCGAAPGNMKDGVCEFCGPLAAKKGKAMNAPKPLGELIGEPLSDKAAPNYSQPIEIPPEKPKWLKRVEKEARKLNKKIDKLELFIYGEETLGYTEEYYSLPRNEKRLLERQLVFMEEYAKTLFDRIENYNIGQSE